MLSKTFIIKKPNQGILVIEVLIAIALITIALMSLFGLAVFSLRVSLLIKETTFANALAQETIEAIRNFRDGTTWDTDGLETLSTGDSNPHYPELDTGVSPSKWTLPEGTETIDGFTRKVVFEEVSRDSITNDIEAIYDSNNDDPNTRKAIVTVSWKDKKIEIITYFTNWR